MKVLFYAATSDINPDTPCTVSARIGSANIYLHCMCSDPSLTSKVGLCANIRYNGEEDNLAKIDPARPLPGLLGVVQGAAVAPAVLVGRRENIRPTF